MRNVTRRSIVLFALVGIGLLTAIAVGCNSSIEAETSTTDLVKDSDASSSDIDKKSKGQNASAREIKAPGKNDWPSFRNGDLQQGIAGSELPDKLELLWKIEVIDGVVATPRHR